MMSGRSAGSSGGGGVGGGPALGGPPVAAIGGPPRAATSASIGGTAAPVNAIAHAHIPGDSGAGALGEFDACIVLHPNICMVCWIIGLCMIHGANKQTHHIS